MTHYGISRRTALAAGLGVAVLGALAGGGYELVESGTVPGKYQLDKWTGACGSPPPPPRGPLPARHQTQFWSAYRHRQVSMVTLLPTGIDSPRGLPVVVALHGFGGDAVGTAGSLARAMVESGDSRAAASARDGEPAVGDPGAVVRPFAVITVDGGTTYWHRRADGDDPQGMIIHEVLPRAAALGMRTNQIGIVGDSMGGYGALLLAERLGTHAAAVAAISPAVFASYADARRANPGSFDGPADFAANDIFSGIGALRQVPAYVACGSDDPFEPMARQVRMRLARLTGQPPAGAIEAGCHDIAFWARNLSPALQFISRNLL